MSLHRKFVWDGWLLLLELDGDTGDAVLKKYTWGLDLSGPTSPARQQGSIPQGAGGIGGLLATHVVSGAKDYLYYYDNLGNVGQMTDHSGTFVAKYEYNAYGAVQTQSGTYASANTFRFSTKYFDDETGLGYWGYRYFSPSLGRWLNRDPIGERDDTNMYSYVRNRPNSALDLLGRRGIYLDFKAFIPDRLGLWFPEPSVPWSVPSPWMFKGDNRGFGEAGTSKLRSYAVVESTRLGHSDAIIRIGSETGESIRRKIWFNWGKWLPGSEYVTEKATADNEGGEAVVHYQCTCATTVIFTGSAAYPFIKAAPSIDYRFVFELVPVAKNRVRVTFRGSHNAFPDYEGLVDVKLHYTYATPWSGPNLINLTNSVEFGPISVVVNAETPPCCSFNASARSGGG